MTKPENDEDDDVRRQQLESYIKREMRQIEKNLPATEELEKLSELAGEEAMKNPKLREAMIEATYLRIKQDHPELLHRSLDEDEAARAELLAAFFYGKPPGPNH